MTKCSLGKMTTTSRPSAAQTATTKRPAKPTKPARVGREFMDSEYPVSYPVIFERHGRLKNYFVCDDRRARLAEHLGGRKIVIRAKPSRRRPNREAEARPRKDLVTRFKKRDLRDAARPQKHCVLVVPQSNPRLTSDHHKFMLQEALSKKLTDIMV